MAPDEQQAQLLNILRRRRGQPVAYGELQAAGIEFPAGVVAELELAGVEIERCHTAGPGERPVKAVRLRSPSRGPVEEPRARAHEARASVRPAAGWSEVRLYRASRQSGREDQRLGSTESDPMAALSPAIVAPAAVRRRPRHRLRARVLVLLALLLAVAAIVFVVLSGTAGGHHNRPRSAPHHRAAVGEERTIILYLRQSEATGLSI